MMVEVQIALIPVGSADGRIKVALQDPEVRCVDRSVQIEIALFGETQFDPIGAAGFEADEGIRAADIGTGDFAAGDQRRDR